MINFKIITQPFNRVYTYVINSFLEGIDLDWIIKEEEDSYIGRGNCAEKHKVDTFELTNCF